MSCLHDVYEAERASWVAGKLEGAEQAPAEGRKGKDSGGEGRSSLQCIMITSRAAAAQKLQLAYQLMIDSVQL